MKTTKNRPIAMPIFACKDLIGAQKEFILTTCYLSISFDAASEQTGTRKANFQKSHVHRNHSLI